MKILEVLTYYRPHISGLTIYVERLSKALARQGHDVTVLTSQYDSSLPQREVKDGVQINRVPVALRVSKGVIMPSFGLQAWKFVNQTDVIHLHLPQFDAPGVALRGRLLGKPVVLTYHSDLRLPDGIFNRVVDRVVGAMNRAAGSLADAVVTYTDDFGRHSPYLSRYLGTKLHVVPPPVETAEASAEETESFRLRYSLNGHQVIGIVARLAAEKGIEVLLRALPTILDRYPEARVIHAGPFEGVIGEEPYAARLAPMIAEFQGHYDLIGPIEGKELTSMYQNADCLVMCSLNNTETFGLVQVEAMMNGVPVVACDLPGVRQPVAMTGMGEITPVNDPLALAKAVIRVLDNQGAYLRSPESISECFSPDQTAVEYVRLFDDLLAGKTPETNTEPVAYRQLKQLRDAVS